MANEIKQPKDYKYFTERQKAEWAHYVKACAEYEVKLEEHWARARLTRPKEELYQTYADYESRYFKWHMDWSLNEPPRPTWDEVDREICWLAANR